MFGWWGKKKGDEAPVDAVETPTLPVATVEESTKDWAEGDATSPVSSPVASAPTIEEAKAAALEKPLLDEMRVQLGLPPFTLPDGVDTNALDPATEGEWYRQRMLTRFLRARQHKLPDAVAMYTKAMEWRAANNVDTILDEPDPTESIFQCICPHRVHGATTEGHPIYWEFTGRVRMSVLLKAGITEEQIVTRHVRFMELMRRQCHANSKRLGRTIDKIVMIYDLRDMAFTVEPAGLRVFKQTTHIDQNYYPEFLHKFFIVNAPLSFRGVWAVCKPFIDANTLKKFQVLGKSYTENLLELIPASSIPVDFGGTCVCKYENGDTCLAPVRPYPPTDTPPEPWPTLPPVPRVVSSSL